jgi:hypothetical protein
MEKPGRTAELGQKIGQLEQLGGNQEGGTMNRDKDLNQNKNIGSDSIDKDRDVSQGGFGSSQGRSTGSQGNMGSSGSEWNRESSTPRSGNVSGDSKKSERH